MKSKKILVSRTIAAKIHTYIIILLEGKHVTCNVQMFQCNATNISKLCNFFKQKERLKLFERCKYVVQDHENTGTKIY